MRRFASRIATLFSATILAGGYLYAQTVTISPGYTNVPLGGTVQYTATVTGLTPATVKWGVTAGAGTITQTGLYTAPMSVPANGVLISATSTVNSKIAAYNYVNPEVAGPTIAAMSPNPLPVGNDTITLTASASAPFLNGATAVCGGVASGARFVSATSITVAVYVPATPATATCYVNNPGTWQSNSLTVPVMKSAPAPLVSPATASLGPGGTQQFAASNVSTWSATTGAISSTGLYTAPATTASTGTATVTATGPGGASSATVTLLPKPTVTPATVTIVLASTQQFTAVNATKWSATAGSVTSAGLYTAPASMPASGTDTVTATGPSGTGSALITLRNYPAPTVTSLNPTALPLGFFTATIAGSGFLSTSTVTLGGTPLIVTAWSAISLSVSGFAGATGSVNVIVSNGSAASAPRAVQAGNPNALVSAAAARRFLEQAAFGPTPTDAANLQTLGYRGWLNQQFAMGAVSNFNAEVGSQDSMSQQFLVNAAMNPDQLRQKVAFALSQIFVTSLNTLVLNSSMIPYQQMLIADAFTNYRQILGDVTLSPAMGQYLNMANNAMANTATGTVANENYAREVMQLFTVGTNLLNSDGTPQLNGNGLRIPAYTQSTISETARVFTGWTYLPSSGSVQWNDSVNPAGPMVPFPSEHDMGSKQLLNGYAEPAGLSPQQDLHNALDNIFNHPNVGPFVGKILIQHRWRATRALPMCSAWRRLSQITAVA